MSMTVELLAANAGTNIRTVARHWPTYRPGLREKQVHHRINRIRKVMRHGGLKRPAAERLGNLLDCDPGLFLRGESFIQGFSGKTCGAGGNSNVAPGTATEIITTYQPLKVLSGGDQN